MSVFTGILVLVFLVIVFYGSKNCFISNKIYHDYLGKSNNLALRAILSMMVIMNHLSQHSDVGLFEPVFHNTGYHAVGGFMFLSGYGLMKNYVSNNYYKKGFLKKRFFSIIVPYFLIGLVYYIIHSILVQPYTFTEIINSFRYGDPFIHFSWYVVAIILFYFAFWLSMIICKKNYKMVILFNLSVFIVLTAIGRYYLFYSDYWFHASHLFTVGLIWAFYEKNIITFIEKHFYKILIPTLIIFAAISLLKHIFILDILSIDMYLPVAWTNSLLFMFLTLMVLMKAQFGNKILIFLGSISFEFYLCQGIPIVDLRPYIKNELIFCITAILSTIILAYGFSLINKRIRKLSKKI